MDGVFEFWHCFDSIYSLEKKYLSWWRTGQRSKEFQRRSPTSQERNQQIERRGWETDWWYDEREGKTSSNGRNDLRSFGWIAKVLFHLGSWFVLVFHCHALVVWPCDTGSCNTILLFYHCWSIEILNLTDDFLRSPPLVININLAAPVFIHMSTAFWCRLSQPCPIFSGKSWKFVSPVLHPHEQKVCGNIDFRQPDVFIGVLMGYFMVYPLTLRFLTTYELSAEIVNQISLNSYIDNFMVLLLCMD